VAKEIIATMELTVHPDKTRISHLSKGFEFLGYKIKRGKGTKLPSHKIKKKFNPLNIYA
jgi:RNA-directed DNA polymerase